jgi:hypothetical protein
MTWLDILLVSLAVLAAGVYLAHLIWRNLRKKGKADGDLGCGCHTCHFPEQTSGKSLRSDQPSNHD